MGKLLETQPDVTSVSGAGSSRNDWSSPPTWHLFGLLHEILYWNLIIMSVAL